MPEFGITYEQQPIKQDVQVYAILPRYPTIFTEFMSTSIAGLVLHTKGFEPLDGKELSMTGAIMKTGLLMHKFSVRFSIINGASMADEERFKQGLYSLLARCGARKFGISMERIEQ